MVTFRISLRHEFGDISVEGDNENDITNNLTRLKALGRSVEKQLGFDIKIPDQILEKMTDLEYIDRIMLIMSIIKKPLTKPDCKNYTRMIHIPNNWWRGSNFERDMRKRRAKGLINIIKQNPVLYTLSKQGKSYIRDLVNKLES